MSGLEDAAKRQSADAAVDVWSLRQKLAEAEERLRIAQAANILLFLGSRRRMKRGNTGFTSCS